MYKRMDKEDVYHMDAYTPNGVLFNHEEEGNPAITDNMDGPRKHLLTEGSQRKTNTV